VVDAKPEILGHNLETVERLHPDVRPGGRYWRSISFLGAAKGMDPGWLTKTGIILGMGEEAEEIRQAMATSARPGWTFSRWGSICALPGAHPRGSLGHPGRVRGVEGIGEEELGFARGVRSPGPVQLSRQGAGPEVEAGGPGEIREVMEADVQAPAESCLIRAWCRLECDREEPEWREEHDEEERPRR
jgi:hypothetical protein